MAVPSVPDTYDHVPEPPGPRRFAAEGALVAAAFAFGTTFVVVQDAVGDVAPVPFLGLRFLFGTIVLLPVALARGPKRSSARLARAGSIAGLSLAAGYVLQTVGLQYTTTSASAFLTYLLVVFVPVLGALLHRRLPAGALAVAVAIALTGTYLLTGASSVGFGRGELLTIGCAVAFAVHVLLLAAYAPRFDLVQLNVAQLFTVAAICLPLGLFAGGYGDFTRTALLAALYTGFVASALAFMGQLYGQRHLDPTRASLILLLEPVFAAGLGYGRGERLGVTGLAGAALIFVAIVVSELSASRRRTSGDSLTGRSSVGDADGR